MSSKNKINNLEKYNIASSNFLFIYFEMEKGPNTCVEQSNRKIHPKYEEIQSRK